MHSAGKRNIKVPDRFNPSNIVTPSERPPTEVGLIMELEGDPLRDTEHPIYKYLQTMNDTINKKFEMIEHKIEDLDKKCEDVIIEMNSNLVAFKSEIRSEMIDIVNNITSLQEAADKQILSESRAYTNNVQGSLRNEVKGLSERVSVVEGQASRLAAVENSMQQTTLIDYPINNKSTTESSQPHSTRTPKVSFNNILSSTLGPSPLPTSSAHFNVPLSTNYFTQNNSNPIHGNNLSSLSNTSGITLDYAKIPEFDGNLTPLHPEHFLNKVNQYFIVHPVPDHIKVNLISEKLVQNALLWYNTLIPVPLVYDDFLSLFRNHFWSSGIQRVIRNELYRPYFHKNVSTMQEHAMDWINRAKYLHPPIDQSEMIDQIISHFSYNISLALRGLRIQTTNELVQQLSYLQHSPSNNSNSNNNYNNSNYNNNNQNPSTNYPTNNYQGRYQGRSNNNNSIRNNRPQFNGNSNYRTNENQDQSNDPNNIHAIPPLMGTQGNGQRPSL